MPVGEVLALLETEAVVPTRFRSSNSATLPPEPGDAPTTSPPKADEWVAPVAPLPPREARSAPARGAGTATTGRSRSRPTRLSPRARRMLQEHSLSEQSVASIRGTGAGGPRDGARCRGVRTRRGRPGPRRAAGDRHRDADPGPVPPAGRGGSSRDPRGAQPGAASHRRTAQPIGSGDPAGHQPRGRRYGSRRLLAAAAQGPLPAPPRSPAHLYPVLRTRHHCRPARPRPCQVQRHLRGRRGRREALPQPWGSP